MNLLILAEEHVIHAEEHVILAEDKREDAGEMSKNGFLTACARLLESKSMALGYKKFGFLFEKKAEL